MRNHMAAGWFYSPSQIVRYFATRITTLKPPRGQGNRHPIAVLRQLDRHQWLMFFAGFFGWAWDSFDFFTVSLTVTEVAAEFNVLPSSVTWGITVTLMLRSVGALIFGTISDRYGRKYPMITCLVLFIILELATGFTHNLHQFLGVRALYGIAMGGLFGPAACTALEDLPYDARGLLSGLFEQGYAVGYLLSALFYRALVPTTSHGWRSLFWFGAGPPVLIIAYRLWLPETNYFLVMKAERDAEHAARKAAHGDTHVKANEMRAFLQKAGQAIRGNWFLLIYMVVLMSGFNSVSHGSQDLFPTFLKDQLGESATNTTVITVIGQIGALIGGTTIGYISTIIGRRLTMMTACVLGGSLVPAYIFTRSLRIIAPVFFEQFFVGGVWGPIPIHLMELSPPVLRTLTVGLTYQLGNLVSAASATIEATIGERYPLPPLPNGTKRYDYGRVIGIFLGAVWAYMLFFLFMGPEMTPEERAVMAEEAREFEELRRVGTNLHEIGERRAREKLVGKDVMVEDVERPQDIEKNGQEVEHKDVVG